MDLQPRSTVFGLPAARVVRRAVWIAVAWAYVAALAALLFVGLTLLVAAVVLLVVFVFDGADRELIWSNVWSPARIVAWVVFPLAGAVAVWTAAYGSTQESSLRRGVLAVSAAAVGGLAMWLAGSLALPLVGLTLGWTFAVPAEHPARWFVRLILAAVAVPFYPSWDGQSQWVVAAVVATGPAAAGLSVWVGDALWSAAAKLRSRGDGGVVRAPSSLDV